MTGNNGLLYELWEHTEDEGVEYTFCLAGPRGDSARRMVSADAKLIWTVWAGSYFEAMTLYWEHQEWGVYTTDQPEDYEPCPTEWIAEQRSFLAASSSKKGETH